MSNAPAQPPNDPGENKAEWAFRMAKLALDDTALKDKALTAARAKYVAASDALIVERKRAAAERAANPVHVRPEPTACQSCHANLVDPVLIASGPARRDFWVPGQFCTDCKLSKRGVRRRPRDSAAALAGRAPHVLPYRDDP